MRGQTTTTNPIKVNSSEISGLKSCLICCLPKFNNFVDDLIANLSSNLNIDLCVSNNLETFVKRVQETDIIWLEWGNQLAVRLTREMGPQLRKKRVICRIHSYEVLDRIADEIDFSCIDDLIFVAPHIMEIFLSRCPHVREQVDRISVVPNGINLERFSFADHAGGFNIAFLGAINHKKDPMVLMHAFRTIRRHDDRYRLHIAGTFQDDRYRHAMMTYIANNGLQDAVNFHGRQKDVNAWLENKHFIICTSLMEGHPVGLMEAMAKGIKPLIYHFPGASDLYPSDFLWHNEDELLDLIETPYRSIQYRDFVEKNYLVEKQCERINRIIHDKCAEAFYPTNDPLSAGMDAISQHNNAYTWNFPAAVFASQPDSRYRALLTEARKQLRQGKLALGEATLNRVVRIGRHVPDTAFKHLIGIYRSRGDIAALRALWKRAALAAAGRGEVNQFCEFSHYSIYSENIFSPHPCYQYAQVDEDLIDTARLLAKGMTVNVNRPVSAAEQRFSQSVRVGFVLNGLSSTQAPIQLYGPLIDHADRSRFDLYVYSRLGLNSQAARAERYDLTVGRYRNAGALVRFPDRELSPVEEIEFITNAIQSDAIDILIFQTAYFVPQYSIVAALRLAPLQCSISHQQPEYHPDIDMVFNAPGKSWIEEMQRIAPFPITITKPNAEQVQVRVDHGIPDDAVVAISVGRGTYYNQTDFIEAISKALKKHKNLWFVGVGLSDTHRKKLKIAESIIGERLISPGYQTDVMGWLMMADIFLDTFPLSGGSTLVEAMYAGLPVLSFDDTIGAPFRLNELTLAPAYCPKSDLLIPPGDIRRWEDVLTMLVNDKSLRGKFAGYFKRYADKFSPPTVAGQFFNTLSGIHTQNQYRGKTAVSSGIKTE